MQQTTNTILMIRPVNFRMNEQTAVNNYYQKALSDTLPATINAKAQKEFDDFVIKLKENGIDVIVVNDTKNPNIDFLFGTVKKHWGTLYGYRPWKIHFSWGFYSSHSTGFYIKKNAAKKIGKYNLKYTYSADYDYFYRMIVGHKLKGIGTKKNELFGIFRPGGFSSKIKFIDHFFETIKIRLDNKQNKFLVLVIFILKFLKNMGKI
jgi:hypothetical protein